MQIEEAKPKKEWPVNLIANIVLYLFPDEIYCSKMQLWRINVKFRRACEVALLQQKAILEKTHRTSYAMSTLAGLLGGEENLEFQLFLGEPIKWHEFEKTKRVVSGIILPSRIE